MRIHFEMNYDKNVKSIELFEFEYSKITNLIMYNRIF